jgi:transposase
MNRAEIQAIYDAGPEAVIALVERLLTTIAQQQVVMAQQQTLIAQQQAAIEALTARVQQLEDRLAQDSHNSHKPPSSDRPGTKPQSQRQPSGKKPGGQPGHPGRTLRMVEQPDEVVAHAPVCCASCGGSLAEVTGECIERRQVWELPPVTLVVTEHQRQEKRCPGCGHTSQGVFPAEVAQPVQYGARLEAFLVYLLVYQLVPYQRITELIQDLLGRPVSVGTVRNAVQRCAAGLASVVERIRAGILQAPCVNFDETGVRIGARLHWWHVASTAHLTYYDWHAKRGGEAMDAIGLLPEYEGRAIHDGWGAYFRYRCEHGLCNAHHLRELTALWERHGQTWAGEMKELLVAIYACVEEARGSGETALAATMLQTAMAEYDRIVAAGWEANPRPAPSREASDESRPGRKKQSPAQNMLGRLERYREETLAFMGDFAVPFDNNQAERDQRMMKVQQKISGGFRSEEGAEAFSRIRSYISTARKQAQPVLTALESVFQGHPYIPYLSA